MSNPIDVSLYFLPYDYARDGERVFADQYTIAVTRNDGAGMCQVEAETALKAYLAEVENGHLESKGTP